MLVMSALLSNKASFEYGGVIKRGTSDLQAIVKIEGDYPEIQKF